jgi:hypothetical protein
MKNTALLLLLAMPFYGKAQIVLSDGAKLTTSSGTHLVASNGLKLNTGTTLNLQSSTLTCLGDMVNDGSMTSSSSDLFLKGILPQQVSGSWIFRDITLDNATGATILTGAGNELNATGTYWPTAGTLTSNGSLVLKSSATNTARIAQGTGTYITGNVTQERFIPAKAARTYSFVATPFTQSIANGWQQQVHITGAGTGGTVCPALAPHTNGFDATITNAASMFIYDGSKNIGARWNSVTGTNAVNLTAGMGYRMNIRGPRSLGCSLLDGGVNTVSEATLSSNGSLAVANNNMGSFGITLLNNGNATIANDNYLMLGNPYPCEISFAQLLSSNAAAMNNNYAIYAPGNAIGNFAYWNGATFTGSNAGLDDTKGDIIANGQAVFVQSTVAGANINLLFNESMKTGTANNGYFRELPNPNRMRLAYLLADGSKVDEIMVQFANKGTDYQLNSNDILSMNTGSQYIKTLKADRQLALDTRPINYTTDTVNLEIKSSSNGQFSLQMMDAAQLTAKVYLVDRYNSTVQLLDPSASYPFTVNTTNTATQGNRFALVFKKSMAITLLPNDGLEVYPNPVKDKLTVGLPNNGAYSLRLMDMFGRTVLQQQLASSPAFLNLGKLASGTYFLEATDKDGNRHTQKIIKE